MKKHVMLISIVFITNAQIHPTESTDIAQAFELTTTLPSKKDTMHAKAAQTIQGAYRKHKENKLDKKITTINAVKKHVSLDQDGNVLFPKKSDELDMLAQHLQELDPDEIIIVYPADMPNATIKDAVGVKVSNLKKLLKNVMDETEIKAFLAAEEEARRKAILEDAQFRVDTMNEINKLNNNL